MKTSDITLSILIIIIFIILYIFNILAVGIKNIQEDWPEYRCNPIVMPFASVFGHNTATNFTFCIQTMMQNYMGSLTQPIMSNFNILGNISSSINSSLTDVKAFFNYLRTSIEDAVRSIFGVFLNILIEFQRVTINMKDIFKKMIGIMVTLMYTIEGSINTMNSTWNGPPGQLVRALCFHPETKIKLKDGTIVAIKDMPLNSQLKTGAIVHAVMNISNLDENSNFVEDLYKLKGGENNEDIIVSGSHLVYDSKLKNFIHVKELANTKINEDNHANLTCLITSNHTIPIGKWIFHDWEDNNGSVSKNII
jgi:hypothetical protein